MNNTLILKGKLQTRRAQRPGAPALPVGKSVDVSDVEAKSQAFRQYVITGESNRRLSILWLKCTTGRLWLKVTGSNNFFPVMGSELMIP